MRLFFGRTLQRSEVPLIERTASLGVAWISALLFVGEYWARIFVFFRREPFPGLLQQARDSVRVCRPGGA